jgi:hypothetical protein
MSFDLRFPIGMFFSLYGAILIFYGLLADSRIYTRSLGININLYWGIVLLLFGATMLLLALRGRSGAK